MYLYTPGSHRKRQRGKTNRYRAKLKSKQRRRVNRMAGRRLSAVKRG
jgi:hypothetical protein